MFTTNEVSALQTLVRIWSIEEFALIGATAMRLHLGDRSRVTQDIDLALGVSLDRYPAGLESVSGWSRHPTREHRWIAPGDVYVDVVPAGEEDDGLNVLPWPESGIQMSLAGMRLALEQAVPIEAAPGLRVRLAPLEVIALLKMVSFLDRPHERDRDLEDIAVILDEYIAATDDRRYGDEILELALRYEEASPFLLGRKLASMVNQREREVVGRFIDRIKGVGDSTVTQARMLAAAPSSWHRDPEELLVRIAAFQRGFETGTEPAYSTVTDLARLRG
jgi:predicted nucleotidyltransferase